MLLESFKNITVTLMSNSPKTHKFWWTRHHIFEGCEHHCSTSYIVELKWMKRLSSTAMGGEEGWSLSIAFTVFLYFPF